MHYKKHLKELEALEEQQILMSLGINETAEWYKSFIIVPKPNVTVCLCLNSARLNQLLIRPTH